MLLSSVWGQRPGGLQNVTWGLGEAGGNRLEDR